MGIELDPGKVQQQLKYALRKQIVIWAGGYVNESVATNLSTMLTEAMWEVAASTVAKGPEQGITSGVSMIKNWQDP